MLTLLSFAPYRCLLPVEAELSPDVMLGHYALGTVIPPNVTVSRRVRIYHHVPLATKTWIGSPHRIFPE